MSSLNPLDPNGLIAPLQQSSGAQLAGYNTAIQNALAKNFLSTSHPVDMQAAINYPDSPSLKFDADPGFSQGIGNGISNFYALKNYRSRTEMLNNAVLEQREKEKQQRDMLAATTAANQERRTKGRDLLKPEEQSFYDVLSPDEQDKILAEHANAKTKSLTGIETDQAKLNWQRERFHALTGKFPEQIFAQGNQGALTPQVHSAWKYVYNAEPPKDALDFKKRFAESGSSVEGYRGAKIDNETRGPRNQAALDGQLLSNYTAGVNAKFAEKMKEIDYWRGKGEAQKAKDMEKNAGDGNLRFNQLMSIYDKLTPGEIKQYNAIFKSQGVGDIFQLPEKDENTLKPVINKGKVMAWTDKYGNQYNADGSPKQ